MASEVTIVGTLRFEKIEGSLGLWPRIFESRGVKEADVVMSTMLKKEGESEGDSLEDIICLFYTATKEQLASWLPFFSCIKHYPLRSTDEVDSGSI